MLAVGALKIRRPTANHGGAEKNFPDRAFMLDWGQRPSKGQNICRAILLAPGAVQAPHPVRADNHDG